MITGAKASTGQTDNYGYVVSTPYSVKDGDDNYLTYDLWNGTKTVTVIDKDNGVTVAPVKGSILTYTDLGNGYIEADSITALKGAVAGFSSKTLLVDYDLALASLPGDTYTLDEDTQYLYIDTKNYKGVSTGSISVADKNVAETHYIANVYVIPGTSGTADLVVVEVNNKMDASAVASVSTGTGFTIATPAITAPVTGTAAATYPASDFAVYANRTYGAADNDVITFTIVYTGTVTDANDTFTFTPSATSGADTYVAAATGLTGIAPGKTWTCTMAVDGANVVAPVIAITATTV